MLDPDLKVEKLSTWAYATPEMLADAEPLKAMMEYHLSQPGPLRFLERLTGWRYFKARSGYRLRLRVGWRSTLYDFQHPIEWWKRNHPKPEHWGA